MFQNKGKAKDLKKLRALQSQLESDKEESDSETETCKRKRTTKKKQHSSEEVPTIGQEASENNDVLQTVNTSKEPMCTDEPLNELKSSVPDQGRQENGGNDTCEKVSENDNIDGDSRGNGGSVSEVVNESVEVADVNGKKRTRSPSHENDIESDHNQEQVKNIKKKKRHSSNHSDDDNENKMKTGKSRKSSKKSKKSKNKKTRQARTKRNLSIYPGDNFLYSKDSPKVCIKSQD